MITGSAAFLPDHKKRQVHEQATRPGRAAALAVLLLVSAGCVGTASEQPSASDSSELLPSPSVSEKNGPPSSNQIAFSSLRSFNLTGCSGGIFSTRVPLDLVKDMLPAEYEYSQEIGQFVLVRVDLVSCEKIAENGFDLGPSSMAFVSSPLKRAGDHDGTGRSLWWVHEVSASIGQLGAMLTSSGMGVNASHSSSFDSNMPYVAQLTATARFQNDLLTEFTGTPYTAMKRVDGTRTLFFGEDPAHDFTVLYDVADKSTGEGPAQIRFYSPSKLADLTPAGTVAGTTSALLGTTWVLEQSE